ncbi:MAG: DUF1559 domain-containing protein [Armatimonadota bacterium]
MKRGFTLIELLVVIAIIAILAAILFPVFARAREKARQASCTSNVKQITLGILMYAEDYDERMPLQRYSADGIYWYNNDHAYLQTKYGNYQPLVFPYVKNEQVFMCPSSTRSDPAGQFAYDYAMNCAVDDGRKLADIDAPAERISVGDSTYEWIDRAARIYARHNGGAVLGFCDGHVKWLKAEEIAGNPELYWRGHSSSSWLVSGPPPQK